MIKVLLIDDEPLALQQLCQMAKRIPYFEIMGACESAFEAMQVMESQEVDAIFTDINMPDLSGLDFIHSLPQAPITVFTTAYGQYALEGYKANAIDYLLKPFGQDEFQRVAAKVKQQHELLRASQANSQKETDQPIPLQDGILYMKNGTQMERIELDNTAYVEAQGEYLRLHSVSKKTHTILMGISRMTDLLAGKGFVRIHRSYLVNMKFAERISHTRLCLSNGVELPVGDAFREQVMEFVNRRRIDNICHGEKTKDS